MNILEPNITATTFRELVRTETLGDRLIIRIVGFLVSDDPASETYANYTKIGCDDVGFQFDLIRADRDDLKQMIVNANTDERIHGIFIYYPVFGDIRDDEIKDLVSPRKDVEGLTAYWLNKLYLNERFDDVAKQRKAVLPCTPLAIIKLLEVTDALNPVGLPFAGQTVTVFNRSEVVGRPLAHMLKNDGATVYSFDVNGGVVAGTDTSISRERALKESNIVITGVPSRSFEKVKACELQSGAICLNFSYVKNFDEDVKQVASLFIPRVGTLTVAMCLRNALRLYRNYHQGE